MSNNSDFIWTKFNPTVSRSRNDGIKLEFVNIENSLNLNSYGSELEKKNKELEKKVKMLTGQNRELDYILHGLSHDLRSPMTSILGLVSVMEFSQDDENSQYVDLIKTKIFKMDEFIRSMMDLIKIDKYRPGPKRIDFPTIIKDCLDSLEYLPNYHKIAICTRINDTLHICKNDPVRIRLIFNNLISNAVKYLDLRKHRHYLVIKVKVLKKTTEIKLIDNGMGIGQEHLKNIFKIFYRVNHKIDGSGLGLFIVKKALDKLQGNIKIESKENRYTSIKLTISNNIG